MLITKIKDDLKRNNNKISVGLIEMLSKNSEKTFFMTKNTVICVMRLESGNEIVSYAQVLDENNFDENIGKKVAENKCKDELWKLVGNIAKAIMK